MVTLKPTIKTMCMVAVVDINSNKPENLMMNVSGWRARQEAGLYTSAKIYPAPNKSTRHTLTINRQTGNNTWLHH